ncbi:MAG: PHP domain-containing protein [Deltaproteobacteria bacterium]|nr:PHP domain-containing protein [Deltaproteobacteria bacterium]
MIRLRHVAVTGLYLAGCGSDPGLSDYFPKLPPATGGAPGAFAGQVTDAGQLLTGPAQSGLVGDFYMRNAKASFIIQAPARVIGVIPQGGNLVDAALIDGAGHQVTDDHFGELGLIYLLGRTCEPDKIEIVRDGSKGGVAVIRATGKSGNDDFINIKGIGLLPITADVDPDIDDGVECATTYVLEPDSTTLQVYHSLFNAGADDIAGPMGTIADTGGETHAWTNTFGFQEADIGALATLSKPQPSDYTVYQGPGVAYGIIPRHDTPTTHTQALIAGVSIILDGNDALLDILQKDKYFLHLKRGKGVLQRYDVVVGHDASDIDAAWRTGNGETLSTVTGTVAYTGGGPATDARVGVFVDGNHNGVLDDATVDMDNDGIADDHAISYFDVKADGTFGGQVPTNLGNLLLRAEVKNVGRSEAMSVAPANQAAVVNLNVPSPIKVDFQILDADTSAPIPGRLLVVGNHPAFPDARLFEVADRQGGVVTQEHAIRGTTVNLGDGTDAPLYLPAGGTYRVYASRGTEWSADSAAVSGATDVSLGFHLKHVVPTDGYYATDWHVHQVGSPDSPIGSLERVKSAISAGVEMFAVTDHDYVSDLQPIVEQLGAQNLLRVIPGIEVTPFPYGHFNSWPMQPDNSSANHGAIDWGRGATDGLAMVPGEIFDAMRARGGKMVQVNHPRDSSFTEFQAAFDRANVQFDFTNRMIFGDYEHADVPNDWLRLPETSLWSDQFTGLEIWNGFNMADTNNDGLRENTKLDRTMRDWLSMLSLGFYVTPAGDSDTHTTVADPLGMPRTYVRVASDNAAALADGTAVDAVVATQTGAGGAARDIVVTDGPMISVTSGTQPAIGRQIPSVGAPVTLTVTIISADWAPFDTLEVFANTTPDAIKGKDADSALIPLKCWTSRTIASFNANDPCAKASLAAEAMTVNLATLPGGGGFKRYEATVTVTLDASDITTRAGATGKDAWLVFRARGDRGIFPILPKGDTISDTTMPALLTGDRATIDTALTGHGISAEAVTAPIFVDFDGGGYRAPFAP